MQAILRTAAGDVLCEERYDYVMQLAKSKIIKLARYSAKQGLTCRLDIYRDGGGLIGYYGPEHGYQHLDHGPAANDWWQGAVKAAPGKVGRPRKDKIIDATPKRPVGRPKGAPKPPKESRQRKHPVGSCPYPSIYLLPGQADKARTIGNGNISAGIRAALDAMQL